MSIPLSVREVLNKGYVQIMDVHGDLKRILYAARFCYSREEIPLGDEEKFVESLFRRGHNTPIEHCVFCIQAKTPIFIARQWLRHRMGTFNERSLRYNQVSKGADFYIPHSWPVASSVHTEYLYDEMLLRYQRLIDADVPPEQARSILPVSLYTEFIWTVNAWSLYNWLGKRLAPGAQWEHAEYARAVLDMLCELTPLGPIMKRCLGEDGDI